MLWELARAVGYRTAYVSSQNPDYEDFGTFTRRAGIDVLETALDLGGMKQEQVGAPDEVAIDAALRFVKDVPEGRPYFLVVHLSNTHAPYRVDPALLPYTPQSPDPLGGAKPAFPQPLPRRAVRFQERTPRGASSRSLRARSRPGTARRCSSCRITASSSASTGASTTTIRSTTKSSGSRAGSPPAGARSPTSSAPPSRRTPASRPTRRTCTRRWSTSSASEDARARLPQAALVTGRSLLRPWTGDPTVLLATSTSVWEPDDARYGVMHGDALLFGGPTGRWQCFNLGADPTEHAPGPADACAGLLEVAKREFGGVATPR